MLSPEQSRAWRVACRRRQAREAAWLRFERTRDPWGPLLAVGAVVAAGFLCGRAV